MIDVLNPPEVIRQSSLRLPAALLFAALLFMVANSPSVAAAPDGLTAAAVVKNVNERNEGETLMRVMSMELVNGKGKVRKREATVVRITGDDRRQSLIKFSNPRAVKDMSFLTLDENDPTATDKQWMYLPAMRKTRRIPASNLNDSFMGTDFSYRDIKDEFKLDEQAYHFELTSFDPASQTAMLRGTAVSESEAERMGHHGFELTVDTQTWLPRVIHYQDDKGEPLKTISLHDVSLIDDIWTPARIESVNHARGSHTVFEYRDTQYNQPVNDSVFAVNRLGR